MSGEYRTIVADPPWEYGLFGGFNANGKGREVRRPLPFAPMSDADIASLPVRQLAAANANLFLWTTNHHLPATFDVLRGWGASYRQAIIWHKTGANPNTGAIAPTSCEFLLYARIGRGVPLLSRLADSLVETKRLANSHSRKPEVFLDLIEQVSPGPYLELFARRARFGWDYWGDESLGTATMPAETTSRPPGPSAEMATAMRAGVGSKDAGGRQAQSVSRPRSVHHSVHGAIGQP